MRRGLIATLFDHIGSSSKPSLVVVVHHHLINLLDLLRIANVEYNLKAISLTPEPQLNCWRYICFPGHEHTYGSQAYMKVQIVQFELPGFQQMRKFYGPITITQDSATCVIPAKQSPQDLSLRLITCLTHTSYQEETCS
jgi:hypothetical protein